MKPRKTVAKNRRRRTGPHPLRDQFSLYRDALRQMKLRAANSPRMDPPIDEEMFSES